MKKTELLWALYISEREFIKHHENQRTSASNILGAIAAGLIVALGTDKLLVVIQLIISIMLMVLGGFGYVFCAKLYALMKLHAERSYQYLDAIILELEDTQITKIKDLSNSRNKKDFPFFSKVALNRIWSSLHLSILSIGIALTAMNIINLFA